MMSRLDNDGRAPKTSKTLSSGKLTKLWKITIFSEQINKNQLSMAILNSYVSLPEGS